MTKIVLWVSDLDAHMAFYTSLLKLVVGDSAPGFVELRSEVNSVLLHELPVEYRASVPLTKQLQAREEVAIKPVFFVDDLEAARERIQETLATITEQAVSYGSSKYQDVVDPEGNVIQLEQNPL